MHALLLLALAASPMDKTVRLGTLTIHFKQTQDKANVHCEIATTVAGVPARVRTAEFEATGDFSGCFELPAAQTERGYFMVREMVNETPHTVLISKSGAVLDVDDMLVHGGRWDLVSN